jgi:hypothetical protein
MQAGFLTLREPRRIQVGKKTSYTSRASESFQAADRLHNCFIAFLILLGLGIGCQAAQPTARTLVGLSVRVLLASGLEYPGTNCLELLAADAS